MPNAQYPILPRHSLLQIERMPLSWEGRKKGPEISHGKLREEEKHHCLFSRISPDNISNLKTTISTTDQHYNHIHVGFLMLSADRLSTIATATASPSCHPCEHHLWASKHIWCPHRLSLGKPQQFRRIPTVATFQTQNSHQGGLWQIILYLRAVFTSTFFSPAKSLLKLLWMLNVCLCFFVFFHASVSVCVREPLLCESVSSLLLRPRPCWTH